MPIKATKIIDLWEIEEDIDNPNVRGSIEYEELTQDMTPCSDSEDME